MSVAVADDAGDDGALVEAEAFVSAGGIAVVTAYVRIVWDAAVAVLVDWSTVLSRKVLR